MRNKFANPYRPSIALAYDAALCRCFMSRMLMLLYCDGRAESYVSIDLFVVESILRKIFSGRNVMCDLAVSIYNSYKFR